MHRQSSTSIPPPAYTLLNLAPPPSELASPGSSTQSLLTFGSEGSEDHSTSSHSGTHHPAPSVLSWTSTDAGEDPPSTTPSLPSGSLRTQSRIVATNHFPRSTSLQTHSASASPRPPSYLEARVPTSTIVYTFSPLMNNSMILLPPPEAPDTRPLYHISVNMNCFNPQSHITTLRRGSTANGIYVGEFEMGPGEDPPIVCMRDSVVKITDAISRQWSVCKRMRLYLHAWTFPGSEKLFWYNAEETIVCYSSPDRNTVYAKFTPMRRPATLTHPVVMAQLEITPTGFPFLDDILMSVMILERQRLIKNVRFVGLVSS